MKIVFMGTPPIAAYMLEQIFLSQEHDIVGVVTVQDKKVGRGQKIQESAVKQMAIHLSIPVAQPEKLKSPEFLETLVSWNADAFVVVAFRMLPQSVWSLPKKGCINLHASLLPQYRGAAPINWAIINGEKTTGVTTFLIEQEIDTGQIIEQVKIGIGENETAGVLHDKIMVQGAKTVISTLQKLESGNYTPLVQDETVDLKPAPKIFKPDCLISFSKSARELHHFIQGLSPYPGAYLNLTYKGKELSLKIFETRIVSEAKMAIQPKLTIETKSLFLEYAGGKLEIKDLQMQGKRRIIAEEFIPGFEVEKAEIP
ncbi:MAG: methionyl-tRNA formyltransferase, partial [Sphingobacteriales bacterium]